MEHIKNILAKRAASLFGDTRERGSSEWSMFNSIQGDTIEMFPVAAPRIRSTRNHPSVAYISKRRAQSTTLFTKHAF